MAHLADTGNFNVDPTQEADALRARIEVLRPVVDQDIDHLLLDSVLLRLQELLDLWQDCRALQQALVQGAAPIALRAMPAPAPAASMQSDSAARDATAHSATPGALLQRLGFSRRRAAQQALPAPDDAAPDDGALPSSTRGASTRPSGRPSAEIADTPVAAHATRHIDFGMAAFSALSAGFALMAYCVLWIGIGWEGGGNGAMMAAVTAAFFAAQDDPAPSMLSFLIWAMVASVVAGIYQFGIFPAIHDFSMLVLVLAAVFLPLGALLHRPKSMLIALPLVVNLTALLSLQNTYSANLQSFVNAAVAMVLGIGFAVVLTRLFVRSVPNGARAGWCARAGVRWPMPPTGMVRRIANSSLRACWICSDCLLHGWHWRPKAATWPRWICSTKYVLA